MPETSELFRWTEQAACLAACRAGEAESDWWFPETGGMTTTELARAICKTCPVKDPCLEWAVVNKETGIWAGTNDRQRRQDREYQARVHGPRFPAEHGTRSKYKSGCRCGLCRKAERVYQMERRAARSVA